MLIPAGGEVSGIGYWDSVVLMTECLLEQSTMATQVKSVTMQTNGQSTV